MAEPALEGLRRYGWRGLYCLLPVTPRGNFGECIHGLTLTEIAKLTMLGVTCLGVLMLLGFKIKHGK